MARLVQTPRKRRPSLSSSSSSSPSASPRIVVVRRTGEPRVPTAATSTRPVTASSTRSVSTSTIGKAKLVDIPPALSLARSRRSMRLSTGSAALLGGDDGERQVERPASRNVSGETLVSPDAGDDGVKEPEKGLLQQGIEALDMDWNVEKLADPTEEVREAEQAQKRSSRKSSRLSTLANAVTSSASTLGKRSREMFESGKEKLLGAQDKDKRASLRSGLAMANAAKESEPEGVAIEEEPPMKKTKVSAHSAPNLLTITETTVVKKSSSKPKKRWLASGLYIGQQRWFNQKLNGVRNQKSIAKRLSEGAPTEEKHALPLPMFAGERMLNVGRDFRMPFDIFAPLPLGQPRPEEWKKTSWNRFIGEAATEWKHNMPRGHYRCICTPSTGCDDDCQNRYMFYECDSGNCNIGAEYCTNRSFAELKERYKRGNRYDIGVELLKTREKGFGVRSCRTFEPGQVIVEYAGEIITKDECERRMKEEYANNECYYLMMFDQKMIIDATRGSIARFVNHSCEPNCKMVKWTVAGQPRMALFAGDEGVMTGEELSYDYNFDPFSTKNVQVCRCGAPSCRGFLGPRTMLQKERQREQERQASEEKLPKPKAKKNSRASTGVLAGTKRKLQALLSDNNTSTAALTTPPISNKRRRATTDGTITLAATQPQPQEQKRVISSASTLVEKENVRPRARLSARSPSSPPARSGSRTSSAEVKSRGAKPLPPLPAQAHKKAGAGGVVRSNTVSALSRVASTLKRTTSALKRKASVRRTGPTAAASPVRREKRVSGIAPLEALTLDFHGQGEEKEEKGNGSAKKSPKTAQRERAGTVRSVQGQRRVEAMRRMGLGSRKGRVGGVGVGKSVRVVEEE